MGLGLAICKALVTVQNGSIHVDQRAKDKGAIMILSFDPI